MANSYTPGAMNLGPQLWRYASHLRKPSVLAFIGITLFYLYLAQGLVLWDDDYGLWQKQLQGLSWLDLIVKRLLSPFPYDQSSWGFSERPLQLLIARILFAVGDTHPLPFFIYRSISMGLLGALAWLLMDELSASRFAKIAAIILIFLAPNTIAAFCWHADFAPTAELLYALSLLIFIKLLPRLPDAPLMSLLRDRQRLLHWSLFTLLVYLGYKSKANLKLIPLVLLATTACVRPRALAWVGLFCSILIVLAIPWSPRSFTNLPPWMPGSGGSPADWMYQESGGLGKAYAWLAGTQDAKGALMSRDFYPLSLFEIYGVFVLLLGAFILFDYLFASNIPPMKEPQKGRIALVTLIFWFLAELAGSTALADINLFFRLRYSFILIVPFGLLISHLLSRLQDSGALKTPRLKQVAIALLAISLVYQARLNLGRGLRYRSSMLGLISVIDQAYVYLDRELPNARLLLLPGFRNYAPPVNAAPVLVNRIELGSWLEAQAYPAETTYGLAWGHANIDGFELVKTFRGCVGPRVLNYTRLCESPLSLYKRLR